MSDHEMSSGDDSGIESDVAAQQVEAASLAEDPDANLTQEELRAKYAAMAAGGEDSKTTSGDADEDGEADDEEESEQSEEESEDEASGDEDVEDIQNALLEEDPDAGLSAEQLRAKYAALAADAQKAERKNKLSSMVDLEADASSGASADEADEMDIDSEEENAMKQFIDTSAGRKTSSAKEGKTKRVRKRKAVEQLSKGDLDLLKDSGVAIEGRPLDDDVLDTSSDDSDSDSENEDGGTSTKRRRLRPVKRRKTKHVYEPLPAEAQGGMTTVEATGEGLGDGQVVIQQLGDEEGDRIDQLQDDLNANMDDDLFGGTENERILDLFGDMSALFGADAAADIAGGEDDWYADDYDLQGSDMEDAAGQDDFALEVKEADVPERYTNRVSSRVDVTALFSLENEASWIYNRVFANKHERYADEDGTCEVIQNVLNYIRVDNVEVPYIFQYCKDYVGLFSQDELWSIEKYDQLWDTLAVQRSQLMSMVKRLDDLDMDLELFIEEAWTQSQLDSAYKYLVTQLSKRAHKVTMDAKGNALTGATMMITEDSDSDVDMEETDGKQKQSKAVQLKKKATRVQSRLRRFARNMDELKLLLKAVGMTPRQLGENLYDGKYKKHEPVDYTGSPEQAAVKTATYANYQTRRAENPPVVEPTDAAADAQVDLTEEGLAAVAVAGKQEDVQSTLKLFRSIAAQLVAQDPFVRAAVYKEMESDGVVNTKPTAKGIREIDPYHQYYCVKRLMDKPLHRFDQTQYLLCKKAENEGFITVTISFPTSGRRNVIDADGMDTTEDTKNGDGEDPFLREVIELYSSSGYGLDSEAWNEQRNLIVTAALSEYIYPSVTKELSRNLLRTAQEYVCSKAARNLKTMVSVYPYLNAVTGRGQGKIISCCVGDGKQASMFVVLNKYGEVLDRLTVHFFKMKIRGDRGSDMELYQKRKDDIRRIQTLFSTHNPSLLTIASVDMQCISFKKQLEETALFDFREIKVEFVDPAIGRIFMNTDRSKDEFKDYPPLMLQAVGIGRYVLNPLDMVCSFWTTDGRKEDNDILGFKLHDLQAFVPARMLLQALGRTLMSAVCYVGIHINAVVHAGHKNSSLQFVPGLGPKSAKQLIQAIQQMRKAHLATREQLLTHCGLGETVYKNAAAFIRVESLDSGRQKSKTSNILDTTRIHPEHYDLVERFVLGALKIDDLDDQTDEDEDDIIMSDVDSEDGETGGDGRRGGDNVDDEAAKKAVEHKKKTQRMLLNVFNDRSQWSILDAFDVEIFAEMEESKGHGKVTRLIKLIKQEVKGRFADVKRRLRTFAAPTESQLYTLLSGETDQTLFAGCLVSAVVVATGRNGVICRLDNGLKGFIDLKMLSDTAPPEQDHFVRDEYDDRGFEDENAAHEAKVQAFIDERVERGMAVTARVMNINKERMSVDLATCSSEVKDTRKQWITKLENDLDDTYLYKESAGMHPEDASFLKQLKAKRNVHRFVQRNVFHPLFRNLSRTESVALLEADNTDYAGECIIRPSTKASNHLTLTIRIHEDILIDVDILEEDKPSKQALGKVLKIQGEVFEDLDEINDRYVMPLIDYGQLLIGHQKFRFGNEDDVTDMLQVEKQQEPNRLPYLISFASDKPGQLYFSYLPNNNTRREKFYIVYNGFHYHSKVYSSVNSLVDAIKRMIKKKMAADRHRGKSGRSERKQPPQRPAYPEQQQQQQYQQQQQQPPRRPGEYNRGDNVQVYYQQVWYNGNIQNVGRDGQETLYTVAFPNGYTTVPATYLRA